MLIRVLVDLNARDVLDVILFYFVVYGGILEIIILLLEVGVDFKLIDNVGWFLVQYVLLRYYYYIILKFGEEYCYDIVKNVLNYIKIKQSIIVDDIII